MSSVTNSDSLPPCSHLPKLQACLQSSDVNYRIAVGETIALLVELGRDLDEVNSHTCTIGSRHTHTLTAETNAVYTSFIIIL